MAKSSFLRKRSILFLLNGIPSVMARTVAVLSIHTIKGLPLTANIFCSTVSPLIIFTFGLSIHVRILNRFSVESADSGFTKIISTSPSYVFLYSSIFGNDLIQAEHRSEEHTSELQSRENLVCRLLLEQKKQINNRNPDTH